jgi:hypothetical protein
MLEFLNYKQRLVSLRGELADMQRAMNVIAEKARISQDLKDVARYFARLCGMLIAVVDSLPGKSIAQAQGVTNGQSRRTTEP